MYCVGFTDTLTLSVPLQILKLLAADFDGKVLISYRYFDNMLNESTSPSLKPLNCWEFDVTIKLQSN